MTRMVSPDGGCVQVDVPTVVGARRYTGRIVDVDNPAHAQLLKEAGYFAASAGGVARTVGRRCVCGFASFFRTCSRCGRHIDD